MPWVLKDSFIISRTVKLTDTARGSGEKSIHYQP